MTNLYFDKEFTGLWQGTTPISLGIVDKDNHFFYAEFTDYDKEQCDDFINDEVINNTLFLCVDDDKRADVLASLSDGLDDSSVIMYGTKDEISTVLNNWLAAYNDDIQFISDVEQYDMVLLIDIITDGGSSLDLPKFINYDCINLNTFIAIKNKCSIKEAADVIREDIVDIDIIKDILGVDEPMKHNSLWDAVVIKEICAKYKDMSGGYLLW